MATPCPEGTMATSEGNSNETDCELCKPGTYCLPESSKNGQWIPRVKRTTFFNVRMCWCTSQGDHVSCIVHDKCRHEGGGERIIFIAATSTMLSHSRRCHILLVGSQCVQSRSPVKLSASVALWAGAPQTPCCIRLGHHILSVVDSLRSVM